MRNLSVRSLLTLTRFLLQDTNGVRAMRIGNWLWLELREVVWLASVAGGLSVLSVGLAVVLALVHLV